ncbi:Panacea domain-containing protein [Schleiferilactobacillus shenzhenensis]|uniref:Antitoxin SocA-like Panacea domain-containing protein n=1 Tax=Schleiferilactobacillus shenzhenensis LY-73 TaxID=1231336 RepID=U4TP96_9LACO|nr:type II toxin-antitoxin system antitoxin SocA domain-containing protein [Schleiferilactobacillus shenzhenensis]ERL65270.1 hypothetical protein L248_2945 [Schleiferilactobacillus shenzhenensis LY-73]
MMDVNKLVDWFRVTNFVDVHQNRAAENLTLVKLMNLLYFAQGVNLAETGRPLFDEQMVTWKYGALIKSVYTRFDGRNYVAGKIREHDRNNYHEVEKDPEAGEAVNSVNQAYGGTSASDLMTIIRMQKPWLDANGGQIIDQRVLGRYFAEHVMAHG